MAKKDGVRRATGRDRDEWFALLDGWGAAGRQYREISDWLMSEHDLSRWWAQKLIVEYEQARGLRPPGVRPDGTFEVSTSKTVAAPVERVFDAFVNARQRRKWLTDGRMSLRTSQPGPLGAVRLGGRVDTGQRRLHRQRSIEIHGRGYA
jgi:hypothetical protein